MNLIRIRTFSADTETIASYDTTDRTDLNFRISKDTSFFEKAKKYIIRVFNRILPSAHYSEETYTHPLKHPYFSLYHLNPESINGIYTPNGMCSVKNITTVINSLDDEYKIVYTMALAGYTEKEIAEKLGLNISTVNERIEQSDIRIHQLLEKPHSKS